MNAMNGQSGQGVQPAPQSSAARVRIEGTELSFECGERDTLLTAALRAGIGLPYECNSGGCGSCKIDLVDGVLQVLRPDAPGMKPRDWERGKRLACQSRASGACTIRFREDVRYIPTILPRRMQARLVARQALTHDLTEFSLVAEGEARFLPGQYALMHLPGVAGPRAYSMSNIANREARWEFQIKRVPHGAATALLFDGLEIGAEIALEAPFSIAHLRPEITRDIVCIAGGSGLAPMLSITRGVLAEPAMSSRRVHFFYGGREPDDIVPLERLGVLCGPGTRICFVPVISDGRSEAATSWIGDRGFVHEAVSTRLNAPAGSYEYYLAGPPPMVEAARRMLVLEKSVPIEQVHYDRFF